MHRKGIAVLLMALVLLCLTACFEMTDDTQPEPPCIGICFRQGSDPETAQYRQLLETALAEKGYQVLTADSKNDQSKQNAQLQDLLEQGCALVIVEPVMLAEAQGIVELLRQADVPGVIVNREPDVEVMSSWDRISFVGSDTSQPGFLQGQIVLNLPDQGDVNGDGVVSYIVIAGPEDHVEAKLRSENCVKGLTSTGMETNLIAQLTGDWSQESGRQLCAQILGTYGMDIEVVFCSNDAMALGAMEAIRSGGWTVGQDMYLVGIGAGEDTLKAIGQGTMTGTVQQDLTGQVDKVLEIVKRMLAGERTQQINYVEYIKVTAQNVAQIDQSEK